MQCRFAATELRGFVLSREIGQWRDLTRHRNRADRSTRECGQSVAQDAARGQDQDLVGGDGYDGGERRGDDRGAARKQVKRLEKMSFEVSLKKRRARLESSPIELQTKQATIWWPQEGFILPYPARGWGFGGVNP
jgi:hypothetical protein